jgi:predicted phage tail protein
VETDLHRIGRRFGVAVRKDHALAAVRAVVLRCHPHIRLARVRQQRIPRAGEQGPKRQVAGRKALRARNVEIRSVRNPANAKFAPYLHTVEQNRVVYRVRFEKAGKLTAVISGNTENGQMLPLECAL